MNETCYKIENKHKIERHFKYLIIALTINSLQIKLGFVMFYFYNDKDTYPSSKTNLLTRMHQKPKSCFHNPCVF